MRRPARNAPRRPGHAGASRGFSTSPARSGGVATAPSADLGALLQAALSQHQDGQLAEADRLYRQVLALDPEQPDALHLLGVLALQVGRADVAVPLIERAITHRPNAPAFRMNLGNALLALGQTEPAVDAYQLAATLQPGDPNIHYNLGNALLQQEDAEGGVAALRRALQLRPDHADTQYNLGNGLRALGQLPDAVSAYEAALRLQPGYVDALANLGMALHDLGRFDDARPHFEQALALQPNHQPALRGLATIEQVAGRHGEAATLFARVLAVSSDDPNMHRQLAVNLEKSGQSAAAFDAVVAGLQRFPKHRPLVVTLVDLLQEMTQHIDGVTATVVRAGLLEAANDDTFPPEKLIPPIARLIVAAPEYDGLLAAIKAGIDPLAAGVPVPASLTDEPAVLALLPRMVLCLPDLERVFTGLRRSLFLNGAPNGAVTPFLCALAGAAFLTEYAWIEEADEAEQLATRRAALADLLADPSHDLAEAELQLAMFSLYERVGSLPGAERLVDVPTECWSAPFIQIIREQVLEPLEERRLNAALPAITPIHDDVSQAVRAMYEVNPYPRWRGLRFNGVEPLQHRYKSLCPGEPVPAWPEPVQVLIAGAGTGKHPIQSAMRMPDAQVLGVDLSRTSLAYGARKAAEIGVPNLTLAQADILSLGLAPGVLEQRFALIECAGVLHHLADPMAGWSVLRNLVRPDGLMQISLYSELARAAVVATRELAAAQGAPSTPDGIRSLRRQILDLPPEHPASGLLWSQDFYTQSGFRDFGMHVQEHRFTIPQVAAALDTLDLEFLGFELKPDIRDQYVARFPQPGALLNLDLWDQFEHENPDTFATMYHFWCRPR